ncbi:caspase family protein [Longimicrobium sp.]|uniref:caspase family protein n=1 Tax=Longimicrobium sp. TaxID=2029185 RepID=UPI002CE07A8F|nr:caspase family protein [Longimicrobium sp.]HSU13468.1 caspase family protein [Longimicrobium sp.]
MAARGISLHIGVNHPDPKLFRELRPLRACENDAHAMEALAREQRFDTRWTLTGEAATEPQAKEKIRDAAGLVGSDGLFLLTFSGHGSRVADQDGDEGDGYDETWCLFDGELVDDDLFRLWGEFPRGARIVVLSDSCHSGTVIRTGERKDGAAARDRAPVLRGGQRREMPEARCRPPGVGRRFADGTVAEVGASVLLLSAALDSQTAADGPRYGAFTGALLEAWDGGGFTGTYGDLQARIYQGVRRRRLTQEPGLERAGVRNDDFEAQRPFTIEPPPAGIVRHG